MEDPIAVWTEEEKRLLSKCEVWASCDPGVKITEGATRLSQGDVADGDVSLEDFPYVDSDVSEKCGALPVVVPLDGRHVADDDRLYDRLAHAIYIYGRGLDSGWQHKKTEWDDTLGEGLAFLREKTGADTALIFTGADIISSGSRRAAFVVGLALGVAIPIGQSFITAGLADLKTGEIRWMSYDQSMTLDSRNLEEIQKLVRDFFATYPQQ